MGRKRKAPIAMSNEEFNPKAGQPLFLKPDLALVLAPNPSPMTQFGTNTYLLGKDAVVVIDPGPADNAHFQALRNAIGTRPVTHILLTHSHLDHSPLARPLADATGAQIYAFGPSRSGRSAIMEQLAAEGLAGGGEGIDHTFEPDHQLTDGQVISGAFGQITAIHTPGHIGNHLCFSWGNAMFTGDHVMGWASSLVSPPDGDLTDFMASCRKLRTIPAKVYYPGHGAPVLDPATRLEWLIAHRETREAQILSALGTQSMTPRDITKAVYLDVPDALILAAERNVFAHLIDLHARELVTAQPQLSASALFARQPRE